MNVTVNRVLAALLRGERDWLANLANTAAWLYLRLPSLIGTASIFGGTNAWS